MPLQPSDKLFLNYYNSRRDFRAILVSNRSSWLIFDFAPHQVHRQDIWNTFPAYMTLQTFTHLLYLSGKSHSLDFEELQNFSLGPSKDSEN